MDLKEAKKIFPKYQKWLLDNRNRYLVNKRQLEIMTSQKTITKKETDSLKSAIMIYEIVEDLVEELKDVGVELTIKLDFRKDTKLLKMI